VPAVVNEERAVDEGLDADRATRDDDLGRRVDVLGVEVVTREDESVNRDLVHGKRAPVDGRHEVEARSAEPSHSPDAQPARKERSARSPGSTAWKGRPSLKTSKPMR